jgi:hypothetical protein
VKFCIGISESGKMITECNERRIIHIHSDNISNILARLARDRGWNASTMDAITSRSCSKNSESSWSTLVSDKNLAIRHVIRAIQDSEDEIEAVLRHSMRIINPR